MTERSRILGLLLFATVVSTLCHADEIMVPTTSGEELTAERFAADGRYLVIWFAPEFGFRDNHRALAAKLAERGIEVWMSNIPESLFLPNGTEAIRQLDGSYAADIMESAHSRAGKKIAVVGNSYGAVVALLGARTWQQRRQDDPALVGAILFSPYTYASIPPLGELPRYLPIVSASNIPIMIYQTSGSGIFTQFPTLLEKLQQHGNPVYTQVIPGIMSLFYQHPPTPEMSEQLARLPSSIERMLTLLDGHSLAATAVTLDEEVSVESGIDVALKTFRASIKPVPIDLPDTTGSRVVRADYAGRVTLVNFWATWCPPCVEEIPSLNRLRLKMADLPFELISANYAENDSDIRSFLESVKVDFPVLLDHDGEFARQWNVISYPSTFVIDPKGTIRYGVNAAIHWDDPAVIAALRALLDEP
ncbi:MAG: TlpA family protein disulfide reductase [Gammaproteobacteria bacterium]|nr:TlpA family protein disulfide reductase [Gammaproteobacteria bacterium]